MVAQQSEAAGSEPKGLQVISAWSVLVLTNPVDDEALSSSRCVVIPGFLGTSSSLPCCMAYSPYALPFEIQQLVQFHKGSVWVHSIRLNEHKFKSSRQMSACFGSMRGQTQIKLILRIRGRVVVKRWQWWSQPRSRAMRITNSCTTTYSQKTGAGKWWSAKRWCKNIQ